MMDWKQELIDAHNEARRREEARQKDEDAQSLLQARQRFAEALERLQLGVAVELIEDIAVEGRQDYHNRFWYLSLVLDDVEFTWRPVGDGYSNDRPGLQCRKPCACGGYKYSYAIQQRSDLGNWLASDGTYGLSHTCRKPEPEEGEEPAVPAAAVIVTKSLAEQLCDVVREIIDEEIGAHCHTYHQEG